MIVLANTSIQHLIQSLSWMLIHSLWQGLLLALLTGLFLFMYTQKSASYKYNLLLANFVLFILICAGTFLKHYLQVEVQLNFIVRASFPQLGEIGQVSNFIKNTTAYFSNNAPIIFYCWLIAFAYKTMQMIGNVAYLSKARHFKTVHAPLYWQNKLQLLSEKININRAVTLLETGFVNMPMVIGHFKPVILLPIGLLTGLPISQIEAILMHELAHVRRYDYLINSIQTCIETVFFFNPSLLWLSRLLREERENCCDDLALTQLPSKKEYVSALVSFKEYTLTMRHTVAFSGEKNYLYQRITRIIGKNTATLKRNDRKFLFTAFLLILAFSGLTQMNNHFQIVTRSIQQVNNLSEKINDVDTYFRTPKTAHISPARVVKYNTTSTLAALDSNQHIKYGEIPFENSVTNENRIIYPTYEPSYPNYKQISYYEHSMEQYERSTQQYKKSTDQYAKSDSNNSSEQAHYNLVLELVKTTKNLSKTTKNLSKTTKNLLKTFMNSPRMTKNLPKMTKSLPKMTENFSKKIWNFSKKTYNNLN